MKHSSPWWVLSLVVACALFVLPASADTLMDLIPPQSSNLALGGTVTSSGGWGGGSYPQQLTDGARDYYSWASGLALTYGSDLKWVAVDLGAPTEFNMVVLWQHGVDYTPSTVTLEYWNGSAWMPITVNQRLYDVNGQECHAPGGAMSGYSDCDIYVFDVVTGSGVRWSFYNGQPSITGNSLIHGWVYEFEVYNTPEPSTLLLVGAGLGLVGLSKRFLAK